MGFLILVNVLVEKIFVEDLFIVIGKLQMVYDLFFLLSEDGNLGSFDLLVLWFLLLENFVVLDCNVWVFGQVLVEYWMQDLNIV